MAALLFMVKIDTFSVRLVLKCTKKYVRIVLPNI